MSKESKPDTNSVLEATRKVLLASVGAMVIAQENAEKSVNKFIEDVESFVAKLIERGEIAEQDGKQLLNDVNDRRKSAEAQLSEQVDSVAKTLHLPTRNDIESLTKKLTSLGRKVDELQQAQSESATTEA